jgi:AmmeMemoRadiSam system protein B
VIIPETVVLLGPNHTGRGKAYSIQVEGSWRTPLGDAQINSVLAKTILEGSKYLVEDDSAHEFEHSIEVQIPFLQYERRDIQIVPVVLSEGALDVCREIGKSGYAHNCQF